MEDANARAKAQQLNMQADLRLIKIQARITVYGSREQWLTRNRSFNSQIEQDARNGIEFIEAALKLFPDDAQYLHTYALLLVDGLGEKKAALEVLQRAAQYAPDDIQIEQNIRTLQALLQNTSSGCIVLCACVLSATLGYVLTRICCS